MASERATIKRLRESGIAQNDATIFNERHARNSETPTAAASDAIRAYEALNLIDKPWPPRENAADQTQEIQTKLDELMIDAPIRERDAAVAAA